MMRKFSHDAELDELGPISLQLNEDKRLAMPLPFAIRNLISQIPAEISISSEEIRDAGEVGRIMLRKAVREEEDPVAAKALDFLIDLEDPGIAEACFRRILARPESGIRETCIGHLRERYRDLETRALPQLHDLAMEQAEFAERAKIVYVATRRAEEELDRNALRVLFRRVTNDTSFAETSVVGFLGFVYHAKNERVDEDFSSLFDVPDVLVRLRDYAKKARASEDATVSAWGRKAVVAFASHDYRVLTNGLLSRTASGLLPEAPARGIRITNRAAGFRRRPDRELLRMHRDDYSVACWLSPAGRPSGELPDPFWGVMKKKDWQMGMVMDKDGRLRHVHFFEDGGHVETTARTVLRANEWHHVAITFSRTDGTATLYLDGKLEANATFSAGAEVTERTPIERVCEIIGVPAGTDDGCTFQGSIDDVRLYNRVLSPADVRALYSLGEIWE